MGILTLISIVNRLALVGFFVCIALWVLGHHAFWVRYRRTYPDRRALDGVRLWFFTYLPRAWPTRVVWTPQEDLRLERARRLLVGAWTCGAACGPIYIITMLVLDAARGRIR